MARLPTRTDDTAARIKDFLSGEEAAWTEVVAKVSAVVLLYIEERMSPALKAKCEPQDILQDALTAARANLADFLAQHDGRRSSFVKWLKAISKNAILAQARFFRRKKREPEGTAALQFHDDTGRRDVVPSDPHTSPSGAARRNEVLDSLRGALSRLPPELRTVIVLKHVHDLSLKDIATKRRLTVYEVQKQLVEASRQLRLALDPRGEGMDSVF